MDLAALLASILFLPLGLHSEELRILNEQTIAASFPSLDCCFAHLLGISAVVLFGPDQKGQLRHEHCAGRTANRRQVV